MSKKVVILGGGVAGMSAAHELCERGFQVSVYELKSIAGGKARSINVPNSAAAGKKPLPGEHGFRFFPGFYKHLPDTMERIPYKNNAKGVFDNLVIATRGKMLRYGKKPIEIVTRFPKNPADIEALLDEIFGGNDTGLTKDDLAFFAKRLWVLMTSCEERRLAEYEKMSWWDFIGAEGRSPAYQQLLAIGLTRTLVAAKAKEASARTGGDILLQLIFDMITPGQSSDRLLNGPTNDVWIDPWLDYLKSKGVDYHLGATVEKINCDGKIITSAVISENGKQFEVTGDYFISALPVEVMAQKLTPEILSADPSLKNIKELSPSVAWMNGIQFFLKKNIDIVHGHSIYIDTPWALTSISQRQFWPDVDFKKLGDGTVEGILSVDISDWETPGTLFRDPITGEFKSANDCTAEEIKQEVWFQLKKSLNSNPEQLHNNMLHSSFMAPSTAAAHKNEHADTLVVETSTSTKTVVSGNTVTAEVTETLTITEELHDDHLHSWFLDPDIVIPDEMRPNSSVNLEPLLVNKKDTWKLRPNSKTKIPNLFLASDYIRTYTDLATMEGANEAARRAVNAVLEASGSKEKPCELWMLHEPSLLYTWRKHDEQRFKKGLPWDGQPSGTGFLAFLVKALTWIIRVFKNFLNLFRKKQ